MHNLLISVNCLRFSQKLLSKISEKSENMFFRWKRRQINQIRNFQIFEKISFIARLQPMTKLDVIMPYQQILQKYAYQGIFACRIHICDKNSPKSYDFHEKYKKIEKLIILLISVNCLRFSLETLSRISEKVRKYIFQMEKKTNKSKLEIFKFLRKSALSQGYSL